MRSRTPGIAGRKLLRDQQLIDGVVVPALGKKRISQPQAKRDPSLGENLRGSQIFSGGFLQQKCSSRPVSSCPDQVYGLGVARIAASAKLSIAAECPPEGSFRSRSENARPGCASPFFGSRLKGGLEGGGNIRALVQVV